MRFHDEMTETEIEDRIRTLREEIDGLSQWGAGVSMRLEEIWSLQRVLHHKRTSSAGKEAGQETIQPVGNAPSSLGAPD